MSTLYLISFQCEFTKCLFRKLYQNGDSYEGDWVNGKRDGKGKMIYANGDAYEGDWVNGKGKMIYANGDSYEGDWLNDKRDGKGKYICNF